MSEFETLDEFEAKFVPRKPYGTIANEQIQRLKEVGVPAFFLDDIHRKDLSGFGRGFWWQIDPLAFAPELLYLTKAENALPVLRSAFGTFIVLIEAECYHVDVQRKEMAPIGSDLGVLLNYGITDDALIEEMFYGRYFTEALEREGELEPDEMYAFVPALALGGEARLGNARRVKVREQIALLSQL